MPKSLNTRRYHESISVEDERGDTFVSSQRENIYALQDIDFSCLGFIYGVSHEAARFWFNRVSVLVLLGLVH